MTSARQLLTKLSVAATDADRLHHHLQQQVGLVIIRYPQQRVQILGTGTSKCCGQTAHWQGA